MNESIENLEQVEDQIWSWLEEAVRSAQHPFHTLAFSTLQLREDGHYSPRTRTVVLRQADRVRAELACHTDIRSEKVGDLRKNPRVAWHGYAAELKIQLRLEGSTTLHRGDDLARKAWEQAALSSRRAYVIPLAPGTVVELPQSGLPPDLQGRIPTAAESELGWPNFAVLVTRVEKMEWLHLAAIGHRRALFSRQENSFAGSWLIP